MVKIFEDDGFNKVIEAMIILTVIVIVGLNIGTILDLTIPKEGEPFNYLGKSALVLSPAFVCLFLGISTGVIAAFCISAFGIFVGGICLIIWGLS